MEEVKTCKMYGFGEAVERIKKGERMARSGWNGKGQYIYYVPAAEYEPSTDVAFNEYHGCRVPYRAYIAIKTAQGDVVPWVASQTDILAEDWYVV